MESPKENFHTSTTGVSHHLHQPHIWKPGFRQTPFSAITALLVVLVCAVLSAAILVISNNHIANWKLQPSVVLGILHGVGNTALLYAFWRGVNLSWWRSALHGTTLENLNRLWFCGTSFKSALFSVRHLNKIAVASIVTTIASVVVSPLLQKASHIEAGYFVDDVNIKMNLPNQLPDGFAGIHFNGMPGNTLLSPGFLGAMQDWYEGKTIYTLNDFDFACEGICEANFTGPGIIHDTCSTTSATLNMPALDASGDTLGFSTTFYRFEDTTGTTTLRIESQYISAVDSSCQATMITETCDLYPSTVVYPIIYTNDTLVINPNITVFEADNGQYSTPGDLSTAPFETPAGLLSGLHWFAEAYLAANSSIIHGFDPSGNEIYIEYPNGILATNALDLAPLTPQSICAFQWFSPTDLILEAMTEVSFRAAYAAANTSDLQIFHGAVQVQVSALVIF